jgi:galactokinase
VTDLDIAGIFSSSSFVISEAPGRVNLLGEHTDYNDGFVLPVAIPQKTRIAIRKNALKVFEVYALALGQKAQFTLEKAPDDHFASYVYGCIHEMEKRGIRVPPLDIYIDSNVPMGVGLSSSAALEVAMLRALRSLLNLSLDDVAIAQLGQKVEAQYVGVNCGIMDQMASSLSSTTDMLFLDTRTLDRKLLPIPKGTQILVLDSGISRALADSGYNERRLQCEEASRLLGVRALRDVNDLSSLDSLPELYKKRARHVVTENNRVLRASLGVSAEDFGRLMNESHSSLREDYEVSIPALDHLVDLLKNHSDVYGAKLTGAGFGGACVALCKSGSAALVGEDTLKRYNGISTKGRILVPFN